MHRISCYPYIWVIVNILSFSPSLKMRKNILSFRLLHNYFMYCQYMDNTYTLVNFSSGENLFRVFLILPAWVWISVWMSKVRSENQSSRWWLPLKQMLLMMTSADQTRIEKQFLQNVSNNMKCVFGRSKVCFVGCFKRCHLGLRRSVFQHKDVSYWPRPLAGISTIFRPVPVFFNCFEQTLSAWVSLHDHTMFIEMNSGPWRPLRRVISFCRGSFVW